ncbi:hypothetical protein [Rubripirellula obstinata]|uniref:hypothetical protein n=1 Tax=Rubripirellula obstinata TaxID=406547 RepID=UPI00122C5D81|nr:hypothetical protein [Rubripirellula obstinata]
MLNLVCDHKAEVAEGDRFFFGGRMPPHTGHDARHAGRLTGLAAAKPTAATAWMPSPTLGTMPARW